MMSFQFCCSLIWTYSLVMLYIDGNESSSIVQDHHSDTIDIITYGVNVFRTIMNFEEKHGNLIESLKKIEIKNPRVEQLMIQSSSTVLDMYSCEHADGLNFCGTALEAIEDEYKAFIEYFMKNDSDHKFPSLMAPLQNFGMLEEYIMFGLKWVDTTDNSRSHELFGALVDRYDILVERSCGDFPSLNQYLYLLYNKILLELIKVYSIIIYSYVEPSIQMNSDNRTTNLSDVIDHFQSLVTKYTDDAVKAMNEKSRYIAKSDPSNHIKGITYESLDNFIQGYVTGKAFLNQNGDCGPACSSYDDTVHHKLNVEKYFPKKTICTGRIRSCADSPVEKIYFAAPNSTRRYNGLSNIPSTGKKLEYWGLPPEGHGILSIARYSNVCKICACICDMIDSPNSIRYVDLRTQRSKTHAAFVITGVRFRVINRVFYLQIQEGILQNGKIMPETVSWKKIDNTDRDHNNDSELFKLDYDNRSFDLHDATLPDNYATTMVAFMVRDGVVGLHLKGFHMMNGKLDASSFKMESGQSLEKLSSRSVFQPDGFNVPIMENSKNDKINEPNKYLVKFEFSDWKNDAGQNVVPFIDLQDVTTNPPAPIAGVGMLVRYSGTSGGFLAPKLLSVNEGMNIITGDIKKKIESLRPDVEMADKKRSTLIHTTTPVPRVVSTTPRPKPVTRRSNVPHFFIGNRG